MSRLIVAPIVEGHGDCAAVPVLIRRIWTELLGGEYAHVLRPIRQPRNRLAANLNHTLEHAAQLAVAKIGEARIQGARSLVLILLDADEDAACKLGPDMLAIASAAAAGTACACVLAVVEYESWFVGAADSLSEFLDLREADKLPMRPKESRSAKAWVAERFRGVRYSETVDQPRMTAKMDLAECRRNCPRSTSSAGI